jgi:hypothetical protein
MDTSFCLDALEDALRKGRPEIFNTDQGAQFTSVAFTAKLGTAGVQIQRGWPRALVGQRLRRAAMAQFEIRGGPPEGVCQCSEKPVFTVIFGGAAAFATAISEAVAQGRGPGCVRESRAF